MYQVQTTVSVDQFFAFFDTLELNYTHTYASREVRNLPQLGYLPDNILIAKLQANLTDKAR